MTQIASLNCQLPNQWHPTPVLSPGKSHGWRSLVGCMQSMGSLELDTTEQLHFQFSLSFFLFCFVLFYFFFLFFQFYFIFKCIGEGNGNPLQCSCLENPRDGEAWWAAVHGVAQSRTRLTRLSSSSSNLKFHQYSSCLHNLLFLRSQQAHSFLSDFAPLVSTVQNTLHPIDSYHFSQVL